MIITMHCGGMPFNGETINRSSLGGSESAAYYVARELARRGHRVTLFTSAQQNEATYDGVKYIWHGPVTERSPLGELFHFYATNTPHDVCMIQRMPGAFIHRFASKLNVSWLHDLALYRQGAMVNAAAWNIDAVFTVSEWHKQQVCKVYGLSEDLVRPVRNGIDLSLFEGDINRGFAPAPISLHEGVVNAHHPVEAAPSNQIKLLYVARPERGLEHHVRPGGIMDRLWELDKRFHLYVCHYDNTVPQMRDYYEALWARIEELPNCTMLGALTKQQVASIMRQCDALVYPTEFEDTSCIAAMEAMAAGLPFIASEVGALPETCADSGAVLLPLKDGKADENHFVNCLHPWGEPSIRGDLKKRQLEAAKRYDWSSAVDLFEQHFEEMFAARNKNPETVLQHLVHVSDYYAAQEYQGKRADTQGMEWCTHSALKEMDECYAFARERTWKQHYEAYYEYEKRRGVQYGPEDVTHNNRYRTVAAQLAGLPADSCVLDYGCAHGHYTVNLAKQFPALRFVGVDLAESNVAIARKWAEDDGVKNVRFYQGECVPALTDKSSLELSDRLIVRGSDEAQPKPEEYAAIIAAEVLEHVEAPWDLVDTLSTYLAPGGKMITTTPLGPWEAVGYREHWPWRAHVHHLEREDLHDLFGHHPDFKVSVCASGADKAGDVLGSYVSTFGKPTAPSGRVNYERKFRLLNPRQTLAVCVIARDAELSLGKTLEAVKDIAHEIIVAVDEKTTDATRDIARRYARGFSPVGELVFDIPSATEIGFDEARNRCIARAKADWIMWIDADEVLHNPHNVLKYLRENQYQAYAMKQIHFSVEPAGVLKTDLPSRLFRNNRGIKFFGVVHEHPETELNKGIGHITVIEDVSIAHYGYSTEAVRRGRFDRNIALLVRDREKYPDRTLGKLLWLRDLAQMCGWELERNGNQVTEIMEERARIGIKMWEELLELNQLRMLVDPDNLRFYSTLVQILGKGFDFGFKMDVSKLNGGVHLQRSPDLVGTFATLEHAERLFTQLLKERTKHYDSKYF